MKTPSIVKQKGVTLIELLIALAIFGIVMGAIYRLFIGQTKAYTVQDQVVEVQQTVRSTMDLLLRDLRMTGYDDDSTASKAAGINISTPIAGFTDSSITLNYEYYDSDAAQYQMHTVAYSLVAGNLVRQITRNPPNDSTTETLLENVNNLTFRYGVDAGEDGIVDDQNGDGTIDENDFVPAASVGTSKVIAIRVTLTARPNTNNPDVQKVISNRTLKSAVSLRNLMMK